MSAPRFAPLLAAAGLALATATGMGVQGARARGVGEIVMAVCLSAFESEMAQAGKRPPAGMATYACSCVVGQISSGQGIEEARTSCRSATARRYPI
ncbi:MAG: hypothetical protein VKK43_01385 [Synechococcaceae cyanobacterium]|jgi:hypothetical protein|nr:hypothetical protein [Synechococcaceae cyanobacterium]